jgi:hypothetical protein
MNQKYLISTDPETEQLSIREYAELEKGEFAFVCEEIHDAGELRAAMSDGVESLVSMVRRPNMYPRQDFGERIARGIIDLLSDETGATSMEVFISDADVFAPSDTDIDPRVVTEVNCEQIKAVNSEL